MDANSLGQTNKIPPQSIDAEGAILACIMMDRDAIVKVADILQPEDFYDPKHKLIFAAIIELFSKILFIILPK
jgi:replicative DNA helicase